MRLFQEGAGRIFATSFPNPEFFPQWTEGFWQAVAAWQVGATKVDAARQ